MPLVRYIIHVFVYINVFTYMHARRLSLVAAVRHNDPEELTGLGFIYGLRSRLTKQRPGLATECVVSRREVGPRTAVSGFTCAPIRIRKPCRQRLSLIASRPLGSSPRLNAGREAGIPSYPRVGSLNPELKRKCREGL